MAEYVDVMKLPVNKQFMRRLIKPDTWILNPFLEDCAVPHSHVVIGEKLAAVIDTTDCPYNVREYVETCVTDLPLVTVSSHSHGDHTGNNYQFDGLPQYMSEVAWEEVQQTRIRKPEWAKGDYTPVIVKPGDVIDLGGRTLECIEFNGCHSFSSMAYLDTKYGCLFTGDELEGGQVLIMGGNKPGNCIEKYYNNLKHLKEAVKDRVSCICPPHNGSPMDPLMLDYMIENCERILDGHEGMKDVGSMSFILNPQSYHDLPFTEPVNQQKESVFRKPNENARRSEWKGTSIVYDIHRITYKDVESEVM